MALSNTGIKRSNSTDTRIIGIMDTLEKDYIESLKPVSGDGGQTFAGLGAGGGVIGNQGPVGGTYLPIGGGQMIGPISFFAKLQTISNNRINISRETGDYTSYLIIDAEGVGTSDQINYIDGAEKSQQILTLRGIIGQSITLIHDTSGSGAVSNIKTPNSLNFVLQGDRTVTLYLDSADNFWHFLDDGVYKDIYDKIASGGSGADRQLSNLISPTLINQALTPVNNGILDLGGPFNYWQDAWLSTVRFDLLGTISATDPMVTSDSLGGVRVNFKTGSLFRLYKNGNPFIEFDSTLWKPITDNQIDLGVDGVNRFKNGYFSGVLKSNTATILSSLLVASNFLVSSAVFQVNVSSGIEFIGATIDLRSSIIRLGTLATHDLQFNGRVATDFIPKSPGLYDIGSPSLPFFDGHFVGDLNTDDIVSTGKLDMSGGAFNDDIILGGLNFLQVGSTTTTASSGSRTLPAQPAGFARIKIPGGAIVNVPYYN